MHFCYQACTRQGEERLPRFEPWLQFPKPKRFHSLQSVLFCVRDYIPESRNLIQIVSQTNHHLQGSTGLPPEEKNAGWKRMRAELSASLPSRCLRRTWRHHFNPSLRPFQREVWICFYRHWPQQQSLNLCCIIRIWCCGEKCDQNATNVHRKAASYNESMRTWNSSKAISDVHKSSRTCCLSNWVRI